MKLAKTNYLKKRGFTLVELLVVIVIVVTLASLAFFGGQRALNSAKNATSANNLRQMYNAAQARSQEPIGNKWHRIGDFIPVRAIQSPPYFDRWVDSHWTALLGDVSGYTTPNWPQSDWNVKGTETYLQNPYSETDLDLSSEKTISETIQYAYNYTLGGWFHANHTMDPNIAARMASRVKNNPSNLIMFMETHPDFNKSGVGPWEGGMNPLPPLENRKGYNVIFIDGSAKLLRVSSSSSDFDAQRNLNWKYTGDIGS